ncbi:MAG: VOC family protein [Chthoniobacterales bacterium]
MKITEIAFTAYAVTDLKRSREFYEGVLGLTPGQVMESPDSAWVEYEIAGGTLAIGKMAAWKPSAEGASVAFEVENFEEAIEQLRAHKVGFHYEPFETPVCHMAIVEDPDGSKIIIHKRKKS